ncbi:MAG: serine/threonine protein kinase, partial [Proteobacteria bacterium]|nr:serine/threonine protein kinase [Pseudomonadota bacterium]
MPSGIFTGTERYRLSSILGEGGFGVVYLAFDNQRRTEVALKTARQADAETLFRFKSEFRSLAKLRHRNLIRLYDLVANDTEWFFTMEYVRGMDMLAYVTGRATLETPNVACETWSLGKSSSIEFDQAANHITSFSSSRTAIQVDLQRLRAVLRQLVEGVTTLHSAGFLHRDLKPSNTIVSDEGRLVLLDFGLVKDMVGLESAAHRLVGTVPYMSPEQALMKPLSEASDWYSVGVMVYEILCGRLPHHGTLQEILLQKADPPELSPQEVNREVPSDLSD